jgi:hypothetical protein
LDIDLAAYLADRAGTDLARAIAGHATRLARGELDESLPTWPPPGPTQGRPPTASHMCPR